jgi:integrase
LGQISRTISDAIDAHELFMRIEKGNKPGSVSVTIHRLRGFFPDQELWLDDLTPAMCQRYYEELTKRLAVDTHRNVLVQVRTFLNWCVKKTWIETNPLDGVEGIGRRRHGKPQLRIDEARKWMAAAVDYANSGEVGAVVAMTALLLAMRASEIVKRQVRDLDDGGRLLWIDDTKTEAGRRTLEVPAVLQPHLLRLAENRPAEQMLFGLHDRSFVRRWVRRICTAAKVPMVCAHSMRGLHSTLSRERGITGEVVATALGHVDKRVTEQSYTRPEAISNAQQRRVLEVLNGGRK